METQETELYCSHCKSKKFIKWGKQNDLQRYKCKTCKKTFNSLSGTPLARLKRRGHWLNYANCLKYGRTIRKSAKFCGISISTSFRWRHRFLIGSNLIMPQKLNGIVELNELKLKKSYKGNRKVTREILNKNEKVYIILSRDRNKKTLNFVTEDFSPNKLINKLHTKLDKDILLCTDNKDYYFKFAKLTKLTHGYINLKNKEYIKKNIVHINNILNYQENLINWMKRFHGVATKYLSNYLSWYRGLEEKNMNPNIINLLLKAKNNIKTPTLNDNKF